MRTAIENIKLKEKVVLRRQLDPFTNGKMASLTAISNIALLRPLIEEPKDLKLPKKI
jgi:hypothetical protein